MGLAQKETKGSKSLIFTSVVALSQKGEKKETTAYQRKRKVEQQCQHREKKEENLDLVVMGL